MAVIAPGETPRKLVRAEYVVQTIGSTHENLGASFHLKTRPLRKSFGATWKGGKLAELLNEDGVLNDLISEDLGEFPKMRITITRESEAVRIAFEPGVLAIKSYNASPGQTVALFPSKRRIRIADLIARHLRGVS